MDEDEEEKEVDEEDDPSDKEEVVPRFAKEGRRLAGGVRYHRSGQRGWLRSGKSSSQVASKHCSGLPSIRSLERPGVRPGARGPAAPMYSAGGRGADPGSTSSWGRSAGCEVPYGKPISAIDRASCPPNVVSPQGQSGAIGLVRGSSPAGEAGPANAVPVFLQVKRKAGVGSVSLPSLSGCLLLLLYTNHGLE